MTQWILKNTIDSIPVSFEKLAQMLADGEISDTDFVRPENNGDWQYVDSVIGLCRAADSLRSANGLCDNSRERIAEVEVDAANVSKVQTPRIPGSASNPAGPGMTSARKIQTDVGVPAPPLSWWRVSLFCIGFGIVAWCGWSYWFESTRLAKPAHLAENSEPLTLPWIGAVTSFDAILLGVDTVAIVAFAVWWFRRRHREK